MRTLGFGLLSWVQLWAFNLEPRRLLHQKVSEPCPLPGLGARFQKLEHHEERRRFRPAFGFEGEMAESEPRGAGGEGLLSPPAARCRRDVPCAAREAAALAQEQVPLPSCNNQIKKKKAERKAKSVSQLPGAAAAQPGQGSSLSPLLLLAREVSPSPAARCAVAGGTALGK